MPHIPDALLLIASDCSHCPAMLEHLSKLLKKGNLSRLEVINISVKPEVAQEMGVKSIPWYSIGGFAFTGLMSYQELSERLEQISTGSGKADYLIYLLETRNLQDAVGLLKEQPSLLVELIPLLGDLSQPMAVRIGIGALIEELAESPALEYAQTPLQQLTLSTESQVRADAAHYLGICGDPAAIPMVRVLLDDDNPEVSEIAAETLALLHDKP